MIDPKNGFIFLDKIKETKTVGEIDLISIFDEEDRYSKATVVYCDSDTPLKPGDVVLYDKNNGHTHQYEDKLLLVLHTRDVVGLI